jgi:hypothetical protein
MSGTTPDVSRVQGPRIRRVGMLAAGAVVLLLGVALGSRLGGVSAPSPAAPSVAPGSSPALAATAPGDTSPGATPFSEPVVHVESVDEALKQAYYAAGAGIGLCVVDAAPTCQSHTELVPLNGPQLPPSFSDSAWAALHPFNVTGIEFVGIETLNAAAVTATVLPISSDTNDTIGDDVEVTNPDGQGVYYLTLGGLEPGRNLVVVRALEPTVSPGIDGLPHAYEWRINLLAVDVSR